ncbi:sensory box histidine kinase/response regulator [Sandaracinus amylolyticus]|uniref:histidine kinase n=1 Tax=Sandaracinus amylolyticus TaxID=927083 RepID=A0A0F6SHV5_9BACT|nr:sensory box histidine kinase/response regulator [Sandaracinus amylolyticus]
MIASALLVALLARAMWRDRKHTPGAGAYAVALVAQLAWLAGYTGELLAADLDRKLLWDDLTWLPTAIVGGAALRFAGERTGRRRAGDALLLAYAVVVVPAALWIAAERWHRTLRDGAYVADAPPFGALFYPFHALDVALSLAVLLAVVGASGLVVADAWGHRGRSRVVSALLAIGIAGPMVFGYFAVIAGITWAGQRDIAPLTFGTFALVTALAVRWGRGLEVVPVARERIVEGLSDAVLVVDARDRVIDANAAARALLSLDASSTAEPSTAVRAVLASIRDGATSIELEGRRFDVRVSSIGEGTFERDARSIVLHDVSALHAANTELRAVRDDLERRVAERTAEVVERERTLRAIFEHSIQLMGLVSRDGRILRVNPAVLALAGVDEQALLGRALWESPLWGSDAEQIARVREGLALAARGEPFRMLATHAGAAGRVHHVDFSLSPVLDASGAVALIVAEGRDVTELRRAEQERRTLEERLHHLQRLEALGRLAGSVAHDFNNLLAAITANAELARAEAPEGSLGADALRDVLHASESAATLTRQLLALGRKQPAGIGAVDVGAALEKLRGLLAPLLGPGVRLVTSCAPGIGEVRLDAGPFEQVVMNLALNARDAMPGGGTLTIAAEPRAFDEHEARARDVAPGEHVLVTVTDTGAGMSDDVKERAFEPFFTTKPEGKGTGLGLATVYGIVRNAGGVVELESAPGQGTRFEIVLPRAAPRAASHAAAPVSRVVPRGGRQGRILVAEDRPDVSAVIQRVLTLAGHSVVLAATGAEALELLARGPKPDLLVTDVRMPGMDGPTLAREARRLHPALGVLFLSGYADKPLDVETGDPLLAKPFTPAALADAVRELLERSGTAGTAATR